MDEAIKAPADIELRLEAVEVSEDEIGQLYSGDKQDVTH
ncbi:MAG: hypothetical protein QOI21_6213 [Actinomycetota bacterium]|jgi:hypothetical protein|nr:hypothetical protein [Actinomycetota bacterium]